MRTVGMIGLGEMGLPMARNLAAKGFTVHGYDVREEPMAALRAAGGQTVVSAAEAASGADATVVMVRTPAQAEAAVLGEQGALASAKRGSTLIVMSTVGVRCMHRLGDAARAAGLGFLDAPVSGGRPRAEEGTLTIIVGGSAADLTRARPVLDAMGSLVTHVGEVGSGTAVKMANQVLLTASLLAAGEAASLVTAAGVTAETAWDVIRTCTGTTWVVEHWPVASAWVEEYRAGSSLDILVKDTGLAMELARTEGIPVPLLKFVSELIVAVTDRLAGQAT